jgi:hypothetical protein
LKKSESELTWKDLEIGCIVTEPGSSREYCTGDWRSQNLPTTLPGVLNVVYVRFIVRKGASGRMQMAILKPICSGARGAVSAPGNVQPALFQW